MSGATHEIMSRGLGGGRVPLDRDDPAYPGQRDYGRLLLTLYDPIVIGFVAKAVWRFPDEPLIDLYRTNIRDNHLDIGPGTGFLIDHSALPDGSRVTLVDPNPTVLKHASKRLHPLDLTAV